MSLGLAFRKEGKIDVVILDYQMPEYDEHDFLKIMRKHRIFDHIPVIVLSYVDNTKLSRMMTNIGAASFMINPPRSSARIVWTKIWMII